MLKELTDKLLKSMKKLTYKMNSEEVDSEINSATYDNEDASTQIIDMEQQDE